MITIPLVTILISYSFIIAADQFLETTQRTTCFYSLHLVSVMCLHSKSDLIFHPIPSYEIATMWNTWMNKAPIAGKLTYWREQTIGKCQEETVVWFFVPTNQITHKRRKSTSYTGLINACLYPNIDHQSNETREKYNGFYSNKANEIFFG